MKNYPYPDETPKNVEEARAHIESLVRAIQYDLDIAGYNWLVLFPGEEKFYDQPGAGASISVLHPYKRFRISIQSDSLELILNTNNDDAFWLNLEGSIIHELTHVILWDLVEVAVRRFTNSEEIKNQEESTTDHLAIGFHSLIRIARDAQKQVRIGEELLAKHKIQISPSKQKDTRITGYTLSMAIKKLKLGTGKRFSTLKKTLSKKPGISNPGALAASIGRKKFGAKKFSKLAAAGRMRKSK